MAIVTRCVHAKLWLSRSIVATLPSN